MRMTLGYGREEVQVEVATDDLIELSRQPQSPALTDPAQELRRVLETPTRFPALRSALTPDDHVAIVIDETLTPSPLLLPPILGHLELAKVTRSTVTLLFATQQSKDRWLTEPGVEIEGVKTEVHEPGDRKRLSYLATTKAGRRIYLNRTAVDADQTVVLTRRGYDLLLGYSGSAGALYPVLSDQETIEETSGRLSLDVPGEAPWPTRQEAAEVAWLLGAPFMVQIIEGQGEEIAHIVTGLVDSSADGEQLLDARWRVSVTHSADTVLAGISGDPAHLGFNDIARALACAARVVKPNGRIVLLARTGQALDAGAEIIRATDTPEQALKQLHEQHPHDLPAAFQWANAVQQASVYLLSGYPEEAAEELFVTPLQEAGQAQRLIRPGESCVVLQDAHKMMAVVE